MRVFSLACGIVLAACAATPPPAPPPASPPAAELAAAAIERRREETEHIGKLFEPAVTCVRSRALQLAITSNESADIAARAAVGLCGPQLSPWRNAIYRWWAPSSPGEREAIIERGQAKLVEMALTIIVRERQRSLPNR